MFYALEDDRGMYVHASQKMGGYGDRVLCTNDIYYAKTTTSLRLVTRWKNRINGFHLKSIEEIQAGKPLEKLRYYNALSSDWKRIGPVPPVKIIHLTLTKTGEEPQNAI